MDRKKHTILVEVLYDKITLVPANEGNPPHREVEVDVYTTAFTDDNYNTAKHDAKREMDKIIRYGLEMKGGAVIKSIILPSSIRQVGLVNLDLAEVESKAMMESAQETESKNDSQTSIETEPSGKEE